VTEHGAEYTEGLRDGRLQHLEKTMEELSGSFSRAQDSNEKRLRYLENIAASLLAIVMFTGVLPAVWRFVVELGRYANK